MIQFNPDMYLSLYIWHDEGSGRPTFKMFNTNAIIVCFNS